MSVWSNHVNVYACRPFTCGSFSYIGIPLSSDKKALEVLKRG